MAPLLLQYDPAEVPSGGFAVVSCVSKTLKADWLEPAGHSFHSLALRIFGILHSAEEESKDNEPKAKDGESPAIDSSSWESGKSKKKSKSGAEEDHYAMLGLAHLRYLATEDQIRKAYREAALKFHPDKQAAMLLGELTEEAKAEKKEEIETRFKSIQESYEILMDPLKRRTYDSLDEFDDEVPNDCAPGDFFKVFGPVFMRNGRWSVVQPAVMLGEIDTTYEELDKFYDFWWSFKSWREFPDEDEFDLESAESREHKRWMERQNAKMREKAKKDEYARIRRLVENAYRKDPRLAKRKEEEKQEKIRKKLERGAAKRAAEEEEKRLAEEQRLKKEEEDRRAAEELANQKKIKERQKKLLRKEKARLRAAASECMAASPIGKPSLPWGVPEDDVESLCQGLEFDQIKLLSDALESENEGENDVKYRANLLRLWLKTMNSKEWNGKYPAEHLLQEFNISFETLNSLSSASELKTEKGMKANEKERESTATNGSISSNGSAEGKDTTVTETGRKEKAEVKRGQQKNKPWSREEVELLRKAIIKFPKGTSQRWEVISEYLKTGRTAEEIVKGVKTVLLTKPDDSKAFDSFLEKRKNPKDIQSPLSKRDESADSVSLPNGLNDSNEKINGADESSDANDTSSSKLNDSDVGSDKPKPVKEASDIWSDAQEVALVKAIKAFPKSTDKRWERISAAVPGKNKTQCFQKFRSMQENFRSKKSSSTE